MVVVRERIPARTEELDRVRGLVERAAIDFGFDRETAFRLALAVDEASTNIIRHSYGSDAAQSFGLEIAIDADRFIVELSDTGQSFDPVALPPLDKEAYFEKFSRGGLGLHIIRMVMDDVLYRVTSGTNRLRLVKQRSAPR